MNNSLQHVGVLGMKWGVHRFKRTPNSQDHTVSRELKKKKISQLSNAELKTLATRLQLEKQVKDLGGSQTSRGQKILTSILFNVGKKVAGQYASQKGYQNIANVIDGIPIN